MLLGFFIAVAALSKLPSAQLQLYTNGLNATSALSLGCSTAINATLNCDPLLLALSSSDFYGPLNNASIQSVCSPSCGVSLANYHSSVQRACSNDPAPWPGIPAVWAGDALWSVYNRTCLINTATGAYCVDEIFTWAANRTDDVSITSLPTVQLCSECILSLFQTIQGTSYSNYGPNMIAAWTSAQQTCGVQLPTDVQPIVTNVTLPGFASSSSNASQTCLSGQTYTVVSGDDCQTIAAAKKVATGTLKIINSLLPDCSNLLLGQVLCLPQPCSTYLVQPGDTCTSIAVTNGMTVSALIGYNPALNRECTNLLSGTNVCLSPAAGLYTPTTISGVAATPSGQYASSTVPAPGPIASGTTQNCGMWYKVKSGDVCQQISLNSSITVTLFQQINSGIDAVCDNLVPGLYYCVQPILAWNVTDSGVPTSSATEAPPAPTPSGTTGSCYLWYIIKPGDFCALIQDSFGISFAQFQAWNQNLNANCTNLLAGDAYCVAGSSSNATTTPTTATSGSSSGSSASFTSSGSTSVSPSTTPIACKETYKVKSGDTCFAIWTASAITQSQLRTWNPSLDSSCDLQVGQVLCVSA